MYKSDTVKYTVNCGDCYISSICILEGHLHILYSDSIYHVCNLQREWFLYKRRKMRRTFRTLKHISLGSSEIWFLLQFSYSVLESSPQPCRSIGENSNILHTQGFQSSSPKLLLTIPIPLPQCQQPYLLVTKCGVSCWVPRWRWQFCLTYKQGWWCDLGRWSELYQLIFKKEQDTFKKAPLASYPQTSALTYSNMDDHIL